MLLHHSHHHQLATQHTCLFVKDFTLFQTKIPGKVDDDDAAFAVIPGIYFMHFFVNKFKFFFRVFFQRHHQIHVCT